MENEEDFLYELDEEEKYEKLKKYLLRMLTADKHAYLKACKKLATFMEWEGITKFDLEWVRKDPDLENLVTDEVIEDLTDYFCDFIGTYSTISIRREAAKTAKLEKRNRK